MQAKHREERQRLDELRAELEKLTAQESRLPPESERLSQQLTQGRTLVAQREASCEASLASKTQKLAELDKGCGMYRSRLGLTFERVGDERLRLTFVNIDANDPMRPFAFQVFVDAGDKYHVRLDSPRTVSSARACDAPGRPPPPDRWLMLSALSCLRATQVESCEPPVMGMDELVTQLNTNNDFAAFVRAMRKRFKAIA